MDQHASVGGRGNIVVQLRGDGNTLAFDASLPSLWLKTFEGSAFAAPPAREERRGAAGHTATGLP